MNFATPFPVESFLEVVDRQISITSKIPFRNRYLDIQLRFSYIPLIQKPRLYLPILSYHRLI